MFIRFYFLIRRSQQARNAVIVQMRKRIIARQIRDIQPIGRTRRSALGNLLQRIFEHLTHAIAVRTGNHHRLTQTERVKIRSHSRVAHPFGFIHRQNHRTTGFAQIVGNDLIVRIQSRTSVHQKHHQVRFVNRLARLFRHFMVNPILGHRLKTTGVNHQERPLAHTPLAVMAIARQPRVVSDDRVA